VPVARADLEMPMALAFTRTRYSMLTSSCSVTHTQALRHTFNPFPTLILVTRIRICDASGKSL
jgi:hypothetical protein